MTAHLLQLAIGPVQDLIERARRTRDLWFGSLLLSEISKAAARAVRKGNGKLIFPDNEANLDPENDLSIANIIVAELPAGIGPRDVAVKAKAEVTDVWQERFADPVYRQFHAIIRREIWNDQVGDVFEFYAAWVPFDPSHADKDHYKTQRQRLGRLMAGRKSCRDFLPAQGRAGVPKSSLDGLRETVLKDDKVEPWPPKIHRRLRVRAGEQLDVLGLVKRTASEDEDKPVSHRHYPSVSRIASDPWLRGIARTDEGRQMLDKLLRACADLRTEGLLHRIDDRRYPQYRLFPFEGSALYRTRHHELEEETFEREEDSTDLFHRLREALSGVEGYARKAGLGAEPDPYVAVLVADGDKMGASISELASPDEHRRFSRELAQFALDARGIVQKHLGVLVYSGGDDVLAFLPVDQCLGCAHALHTLFHETMVKALSHEKEALPTLSVGVAIGHFLENLEDLLAYGRDAEKHAKKGEPNRNGLAVHLHKRGGAPIRVRKQWTENLDADLAKAAGWFLGGAVSSRTPYELDRLAEVYDGWPDETVSAAIKADAARIIDRKRPSGTDDQMDRIREALERVTTHAKLRELAAELLIARHLAVALRQSGGKAP